MSFRSRRDLERFLAYAVHGRKPPASETKPARKPPGKARRGPPRDAKYRAWIRTFPCACCGTTRGVQAAHTGTDGGMSMKASDYSCIPLCAHCHTGASDSYHLHQGGKAGWEAQNRIDCAAEVARLNALWRARKGAA